MIAIRQLDARVATAGQLKADDMREVARMGFRAVINNRPDGEAWFGQPSSDTLHAAAVAARLQSHFVPIALPTLGPDEVRAFHTIMRTTEGPMLAFCASGFRCALMWLLAQAAFDHADVDDLIARATHAGHDLSRSRELIERMLIACESGSRPAAQGA
jgi:uncharacterized protein (TIGR01244 family)